MEISECIESVLFKAKAEIIISGYSLNTRLTSRYNSSNLKLSITLTNFIKYGKYAAGTWRRNHVTSTSARNVRRHPGIIAPNMCAIKRAFLEIIIDTAIRVTCYR